MVWNWVGLHAGGLLVGEWDGNGDELFQEDDIGVDGSNIMDMSRVDGWCIEYSISLGPACEAVKSDL